MKRVIAIVLRSLTVILVAAAALAAWSWNGHGFNVEQFAKVRSGMTMSEVKALMGKPSVKHSEDGVAVFWIYTPHLKLCGGIVWFNFSGTVRSTFHDH